MDSNEGLALHTRRRLAHGRAEDADHRKAVAGEQEHRHRARVYEAVRHERALRPPSLPHVIAGSSA